MSNSIPPNGGGQAFELFNRCAHHYLRGPHAHDVKSKVAVPYRAVGVFHSARFANFPLLVLVYRWPVNLHPHIQSNTHQYKDHHTYQREKEKNSTSWRPKASDCTRKIVTFGEGLTLPGLLIVSFGTRENCLLETHTHLYEGAGVFAAFRRLNANAVHHV